MVKLLLISANPADTPSLNIDREIREIKSELRNAEFGKQFVFEVEVAVRLKDLSDVLRQEKPQIVHFSGHTSDTSEILLVDDDGLSNAVSPDTIKSIFHEFKGNIRCVVLNACYSEPLANAIAEDIDCVVGMSGELSDHLAPDFAREFYRQIAGGEDVTSAYRCARIHLGEEASQIRLLALNANPSEIRFVKLTSKNHIELYTHILGLLISAYVIYYLSITIVFSYMRDPKPLLYTSVGVASVLGVFWGFWGFRSIVTPLIKKYGLERSPISTK